MKYDELYNSDVHDFSKWFILNHIIVYTIFMISNDSKWIKATQLIKADELVSSFCMIVFDVIENQWSQYLSLRTSDCVSVYLHMCTRFCQRKQNWVCRNETLSKNLSIFVLC